MTNSPNTPTIKTPIKFGNEVYITSSNIASNINDESENKKATTIVISFSKYFYFFNHLL